MTDKKFDAIVVLGAGITRKGNLTRIAKARMGKAIEFYRNGTAPRIIVTGKNESAAMKAYAIRKGVSEEAVLEEFKSFDTIGNAFFTKKIFLQPNEWHKVVVVTSIFHVPRTKLIFRKVLGKGYNIVFAKSRRVLSNIAFKEKVHLERGLTILTRFLSALVADEDMQAIENFLRKNPLYRQYGKGSGNRA